MSENQATLVSTETKSTKIVIVVGAGSTAAQIAALLSSGEAHISDKQIVLPCPPPAEGMAILAQVVSREDKQDGGTWAEEQQGCHGGCCPTDPKDIDRARANNLRNLADFYVRDKNWTCATALVEAAKVLLDNAGGLGCEQGVWLLNTEASIAESRERYDEALVLYRRAVSIAKSVHGDTHPATIIINANIGETLLDMGSFHSACRMLSESLEQLKSVEPFGDYNREWLDGVIAQLAALVERAQESVKQTGFVPPDLGAVAGDAGNGAVPQQQRLDGGIPQQQQQAPTAGSEEQRREQQELPHSQSL